MISHRVQKRLTHEVHEALALRDKRGQSKHKDKQAARKAAQDNHTAYKTITGLYATTCIMYSLDGDGIAMFVKRILLCS